VRAFFDQQIQQATKEGFTHTLLGRRRYLPELTSQDPGIRQLGQRLAMNTPVQGTAADLIKRAMVEMAQALRKKPMRSRMLLQVHDELVFEVPPDEVELLATLVQRIMEGAIELKVPLAVTIKTGPNWLDLTELT
jgi:DNA polymerase-1